MKNLAPLRKEKLGEKNDGKLYNINKGDYQRNKTISRKGMRRNMSHRQSKFTVPTQIHHWHKINAENT